MRLLRFHYREHEERPFEWQLCSFELERINLLVGRNASGKSRTLRALHGLAMLLSGAAIPSDGLWRVIFVDERDAKQEYALAIRGGNVVEESLTVAGQQRLVRRQDGTGEIDAQSGQMKFQVSTTSVAVVAKRDLIQHPFLEPLYQWAVSLRFYPFGTSMGQNNLVVVIPGGGDADPRQTNAVAALFRRGQKEFGDKFTSTLRDYMGRLGYEVDEIRIEPLPTEVMSIVSADPPLPGPLQGLSVKEHDLSGWTWQLAMSQGMFRALATLIHLAYAEISSKPSCILIDDIGEGLDYERSAQLIQLLMERSQHNGIQLLLATNDRFVMNAVPLEHWAVIRRQGSRCEVINHRSAPQVFEDFKLTGLNNFDFLRSRFFDQAEPSPCP